MKKILCIIFISASTISFAQKKDSLESKTSYLKNEVGFDMVFFLNLFRNQWEPSNTTELILNYERWISPENALRLTWGAGYYNNRVKQDTLPMLSSKNSNNIIAIGFKHEQRLSKKWLFFYGSDLAFEYDFTQSQQGTNSAGVVTTTDKNIYYGPAPFMGITFEVNSRVSFSTETNVNLFFSSKETKEENDKFPLQNISSTTSGFGLAYLLPQNIFMKIKF
jgi:hypothetical protein